MSSKISRLCLLLVAIAFVCSYIVAENGYYEYTIGQKTTITNDKIKEFDEAVHNGENISEWDYFYETEIDYTNRFSNLMYKFSDNSNKLFRKYMQKLFKKLGEVVMEDD